MEPPRLFVAGAGAVGSALALALRRTGWPIGEVACRSEDQARRRCEAIGGGEPIAFASLADAGRDTGRAPLLLLIAVPDRAIHEVAGALAARRWPDGSVALHCSGAVEVAALAPLGAAGLSVGGLHPLKSFVDVGRDADTLAGTVAAVEGDPAAIEVAEAVAARLELSPFPLEPGMRPAWHAAATHACNHLVALVDQSLDLMESAGLPRDQARAALAPLLASTLGNLQAHSPGAALTGPVVRGDLPALQRHIEALAELPADVGQAYRALARRAVRLARDARGLDRDVAAALLDALQS